MSKQPPVTLVAALALTVLGCRKERTHHPDETDPVSPTPGATELDPPLIEDDDAIGDDDDLSDEHDHAAPEQEVPPAGEPETSPADPDMPEAGVPGADPKKPPPPSNRQARG
jgi:hypothetical protein